MKKCDKCWVDNEIDVVFCINCGNKFINDTNSLGDNLKDSIPDNQEIKIEKWDKCSKCWKLNKERTRFCIYCGNKIFVASSTTENNEQNINKPYQEYLITDSEFSNKAKESIKQTTVIITGIWRILLFSEKMIVIGAIMGLIAAIFWISSIFVLSALYILCMAVSLILVYLSNKALLIKKMELSRWQIAIGAAWLPLDILAIQAINSFYWIFSSYWAGVLPSSIGSYSFSAWLSLFSSIFILTWGIMLQWVLLKNIFNQNNN